MKKEKLSKEIKKRIKNIENNRNIEVYNNTEELFSDIEKEIKNTKDNLKNKSDC